MAGMSYRRRNFLSPGAAYEPFRQPGYVEHGSWVTGAPDIVAWSPPEGAGLHGLGQTLTDLACSGSALNASWTTRTRDAMNAGLQAAIAGGIAAGVVGAVSKKPLIGAVVGAVLAMGAYST
jgi:hypothetical protein